jgi:hypothetical protein
LIKRLLEISVDVDGRQFGQQLKRSFPGFKTPHSKHPAH